MIETIETPNRPMLRVLKLAAKLHKAGLSQDETVQFIINCRNDADWDAERGMNPGFVSAARTPADILASSFVWGTTVEGHAYWLEIHRRLGGAL